MWLVVVLLLAWVVLSTWLGVALGRYLGQPVPLPAPYALEQAA